MKKMFVVLPVLVVLFGCAFNRQQVNFSPTTNVMSSDLGKNVTVAVRVVDERPSKSLGRRGAGYGPAAEITEAQDLAVVVQQQLIDGLRKKGFNPVDYDEKKKPRLTVEVRLLEYSTSQGFWTGGVHIKGALKAVAVRDSNNYERLYRTEKEERIVIVPTANTNEQWINAALNDVLSQLLEEEGLFRFLAG
jgi:uncharacterized lipoprotein YajG